MINFNSKAIFIWLFCSISGTISSQSYHTLGSGMNQPIYCLQADTVNSLIIAGGQFSTAGGMNCTAFATWDQIAWDSLRNNLGGTPRALIIYKDTLYAGGGFSKYDSVAGQWSYFSSLIKWDIGIQEWIKAYPRPEKNVQGLREINGDLYIMGNFDSIAGMPASDIARYDGTNIYTYPAVGNSTGWTVNDCYVYNNELYVGGNFSFSPIIDKSDLMKYDGTQWVSVGGGLSGPFSYVNTFAEFQGKLIIGGRFFVADGDPGNGIVAWDGSNWYQLNSGVDGGALGLKLFNNELWVAGGMSDAGGVTVSNLAIWDGIQWKYPGIDLYNTSICFATLNDELYIGGGFTAILSNGDTAYRIIKYNPLTGFNSVDNNSVFNIHPNPAQDYFNLIYSLSQNEEGEVSITDISGKVIYTKILPTYLTTQRIETKDFANGIYNCIVSFGNSQATMKVIINR